MPFCPIIDMFALKRADKKKLSIFQWVTFLHKISATITRNYFTLPNSNRSGGVVKYWYTRNLSISKSFGGIGFKLSKSKNLSPKKNLKLII